MSWKNILASKYNLNDIVMAHSDSKVWDSAVLEWKIIDCEEDEEVVSTCVCGKENIKYLFTICNTVNDEILPFVSRLV